MMTMTGAKPASKTVRRQEPFTSEARPQASTSMREVALPERSKEEWRSTAERVAEHRLYKRNEHIPILKEAFPAQRHMWHVDKFFPFAKDGVLAVDEPSLLTMVKESEAKAKVLRAAGIRMVVIAPSMRYDEILQQLVTENKGS